MIRACKLFWSQVPEGRKPLLRSLMIMWAQIAWVNGLSTWYRLSGSALSQACFSFGVLLSSTWIYFYARRMVRDFLYPRPRPRRRASASWGSE